MSNSWMSTDLFRNTLIKQNLVCLWDELFPWRRWKEATGLKHWTKMSDTPEKPPTWWSLISPKGSRGPWPEALRCWHSCLSPSSLPFSFCPQFGGSSCCGRVSAFPKCGFFPTSLPVTCSCRVHPGIALLLESCNGQVSLLIVFLYLISKMLFFSFHICWYYPKSGRQV